MEKKSIVFVILAFVVAAFYALEIILSIVQRSAGRPSAVKALLLVACIYYGVTKLKNRQDSKA
jgi:hypothetical protein